MVCPAKPCQILQKPHAAAAAARIVKLETVALGVQLMRHGDHRRDADTTAHQDGMCRLLDQGEVVYWLGNKYTPPFDEDAVHQL